MTDLLCEKFNGNSRCTSAEPPRHNTNEDYNAEHESIDHEGPSRELLQKPHQPPDGEERGNRGHDQSKQQHGPSVAIEVDFIELPHFLEARQGNRRQAKKKRQPRRLVPLEAESESCGQGRAGTRYAGNEGANLGDADEHCIEKRSIVNHAFVTGANFRNSQKNRHYNASPTYHAYTAK